MHSHPHVRGAFTSRDLPVPVSLHISRRRGLCTEEAAWQPSEGASLTNRYMKIIDEEDAISEDGEKVDAVEIGEQEEPN